MFANNNLAGVGDRCGDLNGLVPTDWADQIIKFRIPYSMPGELVVGPSETAVQFNESTFLHTIDKPLEIHRMHVALTGLVDDEAGAPTIIPEQQPTTLDRRVRLRVEDTAKNQVIFKSPHLVSTLQKLNEQTWEWEVPYTIGKQEGFTIGVDTALLPSVCVISGADCTTVTLTDITGVRVEVALQGYLIVLRPADSR